MVGFPAPPAQPRVPAIPTPSGGKLVTGTAPGETIDQVAQRLIGTGVTPLEYQQRLRLELASQLILAEADTAQTKARLDQFEPFIPGVPGKPPQANYYPVGATKPEIERWFDGIEAGVTYVNRAAGATTGEGVSSWSRR